MNLRTLQSTVSSALKGSSFNLAGSALGAASTPVPALFATLFESPSLQLNGASVTAGARPAARGTLSSVPRDGRGFLAGMGVAATFRLDRAGTPQVELIFTPIGKDYGLPDALPNLKNSIFSAFSWSGAQFVIDTSKAAALPATFPAAYNQRANSPAVLAALQRGMRFQATVTYAGNDAGMKWLLGARPVALTGPIEWNGARPRFDLASAALGARSLGPYSLPVSLHLVSQLVELPATEDTPADVLPVPFAALTGTLGLPKTSPALAIPFCVEIFSDPLIQVTVIASFDKVSSLGLREMAALLGVPSLASQQPASHFPALAGLSLQQIALTVDAAASRLFMAAATVAFTPPDGPWAPFGKVLTFDGLTITFYVLDPLSSPSLTTVIAATATLAGGTLAAEISLPALDFSCELEEGSPPIDLTALFREATNNAFGNSFQILCTQLTVLGNPTQNQYRYRAVVSEDKPWIFKVDGANFGLTSVGFDLAVQTGTGGGTTGQVFALLIVAGADVHISAEYLGAEDGWQFSGGTLGPENISLTDLVGDVLSLFGVSLPATAPQAVISDLQLMLQTRTMDFEFSCAGNVTMLDKTADIHITIGQTHRDPKSSADITFSGDLTIGRQTFNADFHSSPDGKAVKFSWADTGEPLDLEEIASFFDVPVPSVIHDISLSNAAVTYDSGTHAFTVSCEAKFHIDNRDLDLTVTIERKPKPGLSGQTLTSDDFVITFGGILEVGELKFELDYSADGTLKGSTSDNVEIDLTKAVGEIFELFGFDLPDFLPDVTLENVTISYNTTTKAFDVGGRDKGASQINLGSVTYGIDNAILDLASSIDATTGARKYNGFLRGEITIGGATFQGEFDFGKQTAWKGTWDKSASGGSLQFADLAESHGIDHSLKAPNDSLKPPNDLALDLDRAAFEYDVSKGRFTLSADSKFGQAFFIVNNANGNGDFAFGIEIKLSDMNVPAIGGVELKDVILVLSTVKDDNFIVPTLPDVPSPGTPASNGRTFPNLGTHKMPLQPGVTVAALLDFDSGDILKNFGSAIGQSELLVQAEIKSNTDDGDAGQTTQPSVMFTAWLDGSLTIFGSGSEKLVIMNPRVQLSAAGETFGLRLAGTVLIAIQHVTLHATGALEVTDAGMDAVLQVQGESDGKPAELPFPFGLLGVRLTELDIEVGVDFEPPGVELGIQGKFNISGQQPSKNDFAIVLNLEGEVPNPRYLGSHVEHLTIADMVHAYTGNADSIPLPDFLKVIHGDDLSVYWAEEPGIVLPDGTPTQEGFGFDGTLTIGSFTIHAKLAVGTASGVAGDGELPPIDWAKGALKLTGNGLGVIRNNKEVIPKGGATILINSKSSPYLDISAKATLFNIISEEVEIEVTNSGFKFKLSTTIGSVYHAEFDCELSKSGFKAHGDFKVGINGDIGPIHILGINFGSISLDVDFETTLDVSVDEHGFSLGVSGSFDFEGVHLSLPSFTIEADFNSLEDLPGKIFDQIKNEADKIFKSIFNAAGKLIGPVIEEAEKIGAAVADEAREIAAGAEVAAVKVADDAKAAYDSAKQTAEAAAQAAVQLEHEAGKVFSDAATEAAKIGDEALADVKQVGEEAARVAQAAVDEIANIVQALANIPVIKAAEEAFAAAEKLGEEIGAEAERDCQAIKKAADQTIEAIRKEAEKAVAAIRDEAEKLGKEIADGAKAAVGWVSNAGSTVVEAVSHY